MTELEKYFGGVYDKLETGKYHIDTLDQLEPDIATKSKNYINFLEQTEGKIDKDILKKFVIIQLDYYTFSSTGDVFISDSDYDIATRVMKYYKMDVPTTNHFQPEKLAWPIKKHTAPQMVGSVDKVFDINDVISFIDKECHNIFGTTNVIFAPKYDGVGICLEYDPLKLEITSALTRKDGMYGQELIPLIKKSKNYDAVLNSAVKIFGQNQGFIKGEILLAQEDFDELIKVKPYKNRRNGTSGLINTPSNIE